MNQDLQSNLFTACPLLYKHFKGNPQMQIDCPDDLFEFIFELSSIRVCKIKRKWGRMF